MPQTLLDEVGRLQQPVPAAQVAAWKRELKAAHPAAERGAWLHLWLGEWELARNEQPRQADWHFRQAQRLTNLHDRCFGLAAYDRAIGLFYEGAYGEAGDTLSALLGPKGRSPGYDRRTCALWLRHAQACASYHAERAKLGIPEPPRLDPLCGIASLAACLRALALPSDRATLLGACRVTGEGSTLGDLLNAGRKLGLNARAVTADDGGLMALPKPLVAYVEQDHFVALVRADKAGVSYLCSDCGPWPGGRVDLTWAQWHALSPGLYLTLARPSSASDALLQAALDPSPSAARRALLRLSYGGPLAALHLGVHLPQAALPALRGHVARYLSPLGPGCGTKHDSLHCQDYVDSPMYSPRGSGSGPQQCDPVNLATGEEEYTPAPDLVVYNPQGPSVSFSRLYNSLRAPDPTGKRYNSADFGVGWSHSYNYRILDSAPGSSVSRPISFVQANGASTGITGVPSSATQYCAVPNGAPFTAEWRLTGDPNSYYAYIVLTLTDRSKWIFTPAAGYQGSYDNSVYLLSQIQDHNGHSIYLRYLPGSQGLLATIGDGSHTFLQLNRNSDNTVDSVQDFHGHQVWYHVGNYANANVPANYTQSYQELDNVSQVTSSVTPNAGNPFYFKQGNFVPSASRWTYGYALVSNGFGSPPESFSSLSSITVPSPASTGGTLSPSTARINYGTNFVTSLVDANGNTTAFTQVDGTHTQVTAADRNGKVSYSYTVGFDMNMSMLTKTDGTNSNVVLTKTYGGMSSADPFRPVSVTNGNGNTWQFVWDQYGNLHQTVSPRKNAAGANLVTNYTWAFAPVGVSGIPVPTVVNSVSQTNAPVFGELLSMKQGAKAPTTYAYNDASFPGYSPYYQNYTNSGLIKSITMPLPGSATAVNTTPYSFTYDVYGNVLTAATPGNNQTSTITTTYGYGQDPGDSTHNISLYNPVQPNSYGQPVTVKDQLGHVTHLRYDADGNSLGHAAAVIDPLGNETDYSYIEAGQTTSLAGQLQKITYPATGQTGSQRSYTTFSYLYVGGPLVSSQMYDESGNLIRQVRYAYGPEGEALSASGSTEPVTHGYDALYRPVSLADGNGHVTNYYYNQAGYLDSMTYPGYTGPAFPYVSGPDSVRFTYDAGGNVASRTDGNGVVTSYTHTADPESLLTTVHYSSGQIADVSYGYDSYGRAASMTDGTGSVGYGYDDLDNPLSVLTSYTGLVTQTISYSYFGDGSRQTMSVPYRTYTYGYDGVGRLVSLSNNIGESTNWGYLYNNAANPTNFQLTQADVNGLKTAATYNPLGQLLDLRNTAPSGLLSEFGSQAQSSGLLHDGAGDVTSVPASVPVAPALTGTTSYTYDNGQTGGRSQLIQETSSRGGGSGYAEAFAYDIAGNPTSLRGIPGLFNADNQALTPSANNPAFASDGNGNPGAARGHALSFDPENRLTLANDQNGSVPTAVAVGPNNVLCQLNTNSDRSISILNIDLNTGNVTRTFGPYGPFIGWTCIGVAVGSDNLTRVLWNEGSGIIQGWKIAADGSVTPTPSYGPFAGWACKGIAVGPDNLTRLLWTKADGTMQAWRINADNSVTPTPSYGPFAGGWNCTGIAVGPDNLMRFLWTTTSGIMQGWKINADGSITPTPSYGPFAGWACTGIAVGPDNLTHTLWLRMNGGGGQTWVIHDDGSVSASPVLSPQAGYVPVSLAMDGWNVGRLLFSDTRGDSLILNILPDNVTTGVMTPLSAGHIPATAEGNAYRGDGLRASKGNTYGRTYYLYDGSRPVCELDGSGNLIAQNMFGAGGLVSRNTQTNSLSSSSTVWYAFDERGNVAHRVNSGGGVLSSDLYDAFGGQRAGASDVFGFGGQVGYYTDPETGLILCTHRFYDPQSGRFLTRDPMGYAGGINLYGYVGNNPVNVWDPLGLCGGDDGEPGFWDAVGSGLNVGLKATGSALSLGLYDGGDAKCDPDFGTSKKLAGIGRDALIMAATAGTGEGAIAAEEGTEAAEAGAEGAEDVAGACLRCFTGETLVQMADGSTKAISEVRAGDRVKSRDPQTGKEGAKTVTATIKRLAPAVVTVSLTDAKTGEAEALTCTPEHPLFVTGQGWVEAGSLGIGSSIASRAGPALTVQSVTWKRAQTLAVQPYTVYNLTVEDDHTYFVGTVGGGTWVHNYNCTVIGRMKDLEQFKDNPNVDTWAKSGRNPVDGEPRVTWPENRRWLQDRIDRGDSFGIASDPETLGKEYVENLPNGNFTYRELQHLGQNGIEPFPLY